MQIAKHKVATITYTLTDDSGTVIDQADEATPFAFIHGVGNIIPGLESELETRSAGEDFKVTVAAADGYGERSDDLTQTIGKEMFEGVEDIAPGMQFHAQTNNGLSVVTVTAVEGDQVTIDGNHPLAGMSLNFEGKILDVRDATEEEIEHGHAHGVGGHDH